MVLIFVANDPIFFVEFTGLTADGTSLMFLADDKAGNLLLLLLHVSNNILLPPYLECVALRIGIELCVMEFAHSFMCLLLYPNKNSPSDEVLVLLPVLDGEHLDMVSSTKQTLSRDTSSHSESPPDSLLLLQLLISAANSCCKFFALSLIEFAPDGADVTLCCWWKCRFPLCATMLRFSVDRHRVFIWGFALFSTTSTEMEGDTGFGCCCGGGWFAFASSILFLCIYKPCAQCISKRVQMGCTRWTLSITFVLFQHCTLLTSACN